MMRNLAPGDLVKKAWDLCNQGWPGCSIMNMMHLKVFVFGGILIVLQRFVHGQSHVQPLPTKLVFAYFDCGSYIYIYILNTYIILLHFVFNLCAPSCERFTCKRFWMSPSGFDLSSKTRSSSVAGPFLNPQPWCWKLFCTRMIIDDIWHHILEILRKTLQVGKFWPSFHIFAAQQQAHLRHGQSNELPPRSNLGEVVAIPGLPSIQTSHWHQPIYHNLFHYIPLFQVQKSPLSWELDAQNYVVSGNSMKLSYEDIASYVRW